MENETIFRILLPVLLIAFIVHRGWQTRRRAPKQERVANTLQEEKSSPLVSALGLIAMVSSLLYVVMPDWLAWAALPFPAWLRWLGVLVAIAGFALLEWAQWALGKNWSDTPVKLKDHTLAKGGPYKFVRHPIYTAFLLILTGPLLLSANWLVGLSWLSMTFIDVNERAAAEEGMLRQTFGADYDNLTKKTGRFLPRLLG